MSPLHHAYLLKGWLLGQNVPPEVSEAMQEVIEALGREVVTVSAASALLPPMAVLAKDEPVEDDASDPTDHTPEPAVEKPAAATPVQDELPKRKYNVSPEARAAAADRMRAMQARKRAEREAASTVATSLEPAPPVDPASLRITVSKPRRKSRLTDADWPEIKELLAASRSRVSIASDYDEDADDLNDFILAQQHREGKSPGEAAASPFSGTSDATRRPTW